MCYKGLHEKRRRWIAALPQETRIAIDILTLTEAKLKPRSIERDIVVCAILYLEGDLQPGHTVERWWAEQDRLDGFV